MAVSTKDPLAPVLYAALPFILWMAPLSVLFGVLAVTGLGRAHRSGTPRESTQWAGWVAVAEVGLFWLWLCGSLAG